MITATKVKVAFQTKPQTVGMSANATTPVNKESFQAGGVNFIGHTEIFAALTDTLATRFARVEELTEPFFARERAPSSAPAPEAIFADADAARARMAAWDRLPAFRTDRARTIFRRLEPAVLKEL